MGIGKNASYTVLAMKALIIHGHFYQPPRENPWTGVVDPEPSALPFHDWNERVHAECYLPNSAARIVVVNTAEARIVNNYSRISFDFGPTLLSWLERNHAETYSRIIAADAESVLEHDGHGNAIAQAYSHAILPLCNERDRRTQVRWGVADFRHRFGREPESMWLPETASNDAVLDLLIEEGLKFVVLAPQQAKRIHSRTGIPARPKPTLESSVRLGQTGKSVLQTDAWQDVSDGAIDTSIAYHYFHRDESNRSIAVFFYDQELAHGIAFEQALASSSSLLDRFAQRAIGVGSMVNVATDGESYGHHHKFGDLCLAYVVSGEAQARGFSLVNYGEYLARFPPQTEVEIDNGPNGEGTSWSCVHGVSRWIRGCNCHTGGDPAWNQCWRGPLRAALDYLRDQAADCFEQTRGDLFADPWAARDDAISLVLDQFESRESFLRSHAPRDLSLEGQQRALLFLELQRNTLLMYTSCGWFFSDISGIEPIQILKYACRAIEIMNELGLASPRARFLEILSEARSNRPELGNGADIYRKFVEPSNPFFKTGSEELTGTRA
jgi:alpha-amylase/alpha-mannosidase (GH57 family)